MHQRAIAMSGQIPLLLWENTIFISQINNKSKIYNQNIKDHRRICQLISSGFPTQFSNKNPNRLM